jgi:hypothetical protein
MKSDKFLGYIENLIEIKIEMALRVAASDFRMVRVLRQEELEPLRRDIIEFLDKEKGDI